MKTKTIIGVDPGASGGIAYSIDGKVFLEKLPTNMLDMYSFFSDINLEEYDATVYLEDVGYHQYGNSASSSCKFARHCGHIEMALTALRLKTIKVRPIVWEKTLGTLPSGKGQKVARKNKIREYMQARYPKLNRIYLWGADALGILTYGIEKEK